MPFVRRNTASPLQLLRGDWASIRTRVITENDFGRKSIYFLFYLFRICDILVFVSQPCAILADVWSPGTPVCSAAAVRVAGVSGGAGRKREGACTPGTVIAHQPIRGCHCHTYAAECGCVLAQSLYS